MGALENCPANMHGSVESNARPTRGARPETNVARDYVCMPTCKHGHVLMNRENM